MKRRVVPKQENEDEAGEPLGSDDDDDEDDEEEAQRMEMEIQVSLVTGFRLRSDQTWH